MILGIDIGIKTLGMCIMDASTHCILYWDTIDLISKMCSGTTKKGTVCVNQASFTSASEHFCKIHKTKGCKKYNTNLKTISYHHLSKIVINAFDTLLNVHKDVFEKVTRVRIEMQPRINNKMKFASHVIFTKLSEWYMESKLVMEFVSAHKKTKMTKALGAPNSYYKRKQDSVSFITRYLGQHEQYKEWLDILTKHSKKDDMSDAMCYCLVS